MPKLEQIDRLNAEIKSFADRIDRLDAEIETIEGNKKDVYAEAMSEGFDAEALEAAIAHRRRLTKGTRTILEMYLEAVRGPSASSVTPANGIPEKSLARAPAREAPLSEAVAYVRDAVRPEDWIDYDTNTEELIKESREEGNDAGPSVASPPDNSPFPVGTATAAPIEDVDLPAILDRRNPAQRERRTT